MKFSLGQIAQEILDDMAGLLMRIEDVNPRCIAQLNLDTDLKMCFKISEMQLKRFKLYLEKFYKMPFDQLSYEKEKLPVKDIVTYILVVSDDDTLESMSKKLKVA